MFFTFIRMPKTYNAAKAFAGKNAARKRASTAKAWNGKNASRKRTNTIKAIRRGVNQFGAPLVEAISGMGDYHVGRGIKGPRTHRDGTRKGHSSAHAHVSLEKGEMIITHSEYIGDSISPAAGNTFTTQQYALNPGNISTFPWLSGTAINFQHYKFDKLVFEYRPLVSESSSSAAGSLLSMGSVMMATQYDSPSGIYPTKQTLLESDYASSCKPSDHSLHCVECDPKFNPLGIMYVSGQTNLTVGGNGTDIRMQNLGIFQISNSGVPPSAVATDLGEIWVHYTVRLFKPQLNAGLTNLVSGHFTNSLTTGSPSLTTPFGAGVTALNQPFGEPTNTLSLYFLVNGTCVFPASITGGCFLMYYTVHGTAAASSGDWQNPVNCSLVRIWSTNAAVDTNLDNVSAQNLLVGQTSTSWACIININAPGSTQASIQMGTNVVPTAGLGDLYVTQWNSAILL